MREIMFRGKRIDNGEWVSGSLLVDNDVKTCWISGYEYYTSENGYEREVFSEQVDPETVGQYTGLKDKNGKEIYEGDILRNHRAINEELMLCHWQEPIETGNWTMEKPGFRFQRINGVGTTVWIANKHLEVIGNVHENPELLQVSK